MSTLARRRWRRAIGYAAEQAVAGLVGAALVMIVFFACNL